MDYKSFEDMYRTAYGSDYSDRTLRLTVLRKFLDGTVYDILNYPFVCVSKKNDGQSSPYSYERLPMSSRRPSVISTLCSTVVEDSVAFLFGEGRFPRVEISDEKTQEIMQKIFEESDLSEAMVNVAEDGSVGSGALLIKIINSKFYFESLKTEYLTPVFDKKDPERLIKLTQKYKVKGYDLIAQGYKVKSQNLEYWYMREWTDQEEIYYLPWNEGEESQDETSIYVPSHFTDTARKKFVPRVDKERTLAHSLGFVPVIWIKNLSGGDMIDGKCTFKKGITTNINLDYQLSQCGRGLTYSSEPLLFFREPGMLPNGQIQVGDGAVIVGGENSDVKMIEINGDACMAALAYQEVLRKIVLENIHGNRSNTDKAIHGQSGKALKLLYHPLILLASKLRQSYGKKGLLKTIKMLMEMTHRRAIICEGALVKSKDIDIDATVTLAWPTWFDNDPEDDFKEAQTLGELTNTGVLSKATAIKSISNKYGIQDTDQELATITQEKAEFTAAQPAPPAVKEVFKS